MRPILIAFPVLVLAVILQTAVVSQINLLSGSADLMLLILAAYSLQERVTTAWHWAALAGILVAFISALPWFIPILGYLSIVGVAQLFQRRVWQAPLLAMFAVTFTCTLIMHLMSIIALRLSDVAITWTDSFGLVTLPSILLNMVLAVPVYALIRDLAGWLHPVEAGI